jgi:endoglucanase
VSMPRTRTGASPVEGRRPTGRRRLHGFVAGVVGIALPAALLSVTTGTPALAAQPVPVAPTALDVGAATSLVAAEARLARQAVKRAAASRKAPANPLAGRHWGVYKGNADQSWPPYVSSSGERRRLLAKISLRPKAKWFGRWISNADITTKVRQYIANSTAGNPNALVQMTVFRMVPWEHDACHRLPTRAEQASYRQWTNRFAAGIGRTHTAIVLQPDGPFALCAPHGSRLPSSLIAYSARRFSALPNTSVYIDAGASDWPANNPGEAVRILMPAGIRSVRGFALNSTHYVSTGSDIDFGTRIIAELARRGVRGKHFVINTAQNGRPFTFGQARGAHPDNAKVCATKAERRCVTLGIPPTVNVASPRWGLSSLHRARARAHVDGYLWFGRPWLFMQADPFDMRRALSLARTTPW